MNSNTCPMCSWHIDYFAWNQNIIMGFSIVRTSTGWPAQASIYFPWMKFQKNQPVNVVTKTYLMDRDISNSNAQKYPFLSKLVLLLRYRSNVFLPILRNIHIVFCKEPAMTFIPVLEDNACMLFNIEECGFNCCVYLYICTSKICNCSFTGVYNYSSINAWSTKLLFMILYNHLLLVYLLSL